MPEVAKSASIAMASSPDTPRLRYWRARAAVELGLTEVAEVDAAYLLGLYADRAEGFVIEAQLRIRADEPRVASALLEEALERDPDWAEVPFDLAEAAIKTGDAGAFSVAMARLASVRTRDLDTREQLHSLKARFAMASGDAETAVREFGRAKRTLQRSPAQRLLYIEALVEVQRFTAARRLCTEGGGWPEKDREKAKELCDRAASGGPF